MSFFLNFTMAKVGHHSTGNHGASRAKSTNFQGLVFIPKTDKLLLWHLKWK